MSSATQLDVEEDQGAMKYVKLAMKYLFSHVGLCVLVCAYCVGGAFLFQHVEYGVEEESLMGLLNRSQEIETEREQLAKDLWKHKWSNTFNKTVEDLLNAYHENITKAISDHGYAGTRINSTDELTYGWSFPSALLFTVTIVTTIGYGHIAPTTEVGQLLVIAYSLLGIPLMLMFLANIGDAMANFFRVAYGRGCCYFCWKQRQKNYETSKRRQRRLGDSANDSNRPKSAWSEDGDDLSKKSAKSPRSRSPSPGDLEGARKRRRDSVTSKSSGFGEDPDLDNPIEMDDPDEEVINVPISLTLVIIAAYIFIGAVLFSAWNDGWTWITGAYFSFVTLSTVGFGDLVPGWSEVGTTMGKIKLAVSSFYIILGLAVLSMSFNLMMEEMIAKFRWLGKKLGIVDDDPVPPPMSAIDDKAPLVANEIGDGGGGVNRAASAISDAV